MTTGVTTGVTASVIMAIANSPSKLSLPQQNPGVTTVLEFLILKFPGITSDVWQQRMKPLHRQIQNLHGDIWNCPQLQGVRTAQLVLKSPKTL